MAVMEGHGPPECHFRGALDGATIWWLNPQIKGTRNIWRKLKKSLKQLINRKIVNKNETEKSIEFPNGGLIELHTADDPDSLRGPGIDGVVLDEAAFMKPAIWGNVIEPMLMDTMGWAMFTTTPNGFNWFKELCDEKYGDEEWQHWHLPTWSNLLLPKRERVKVYQRVQSGDPTARQENGAEFVEGVGSEFGRFLGDAVWFTGPIPGDCELRVISVDLSKGKTDKSDYTAIVSMGVDPRHHFWVDAIVERMPMGEIINRTIAVAKNFQPHVVVFEINQFQEYLAEEFNRRAHAARVMTYTCGINNVEKKTVRIRSGLSFMFEYGLVHFRNDSVGAQLLVQQLREFPTGDYDDGPDALEMAVRYWNETAEAA